LKWPRLAAFQLAAGDTSIPLAIEYKCGNIARIVDGKSVPCKNSENDMGTLNSWDKKLNKFGGDNIYYVFVIYHFDDSIKKVIGVEIDSFYKFLDINKNGVLKYREKDGNLRPRDFYSPSKIQTLQQFNGLAKKTERYRSMRIIKKHFGLLSSDDRKKILNELELIAS